MRQDSLLEERHAGIVSPVQIHGPHQGLESVSAHVAVVCGGVPTGVNEAADAHILGQLVECVALHQLGAGVGEEAFALAGEVPVDNIAHGCVEHGVAQELQTLVVDGLSFLVAVHHALVHQGHLVIADVVGIEADDVAQRRIKLLILAEREPYSVYDVGNRSYFIQHTS